MLPCNRVVFELLDKCHCFATNQELAKVFVSLKRLESVNF